MLEKYYRAELADPTADLCSTLRSATNLASNTRSATNMQNTLAKNDALEDKNDKLHLQTIIANSKTAAKHCGKNLFTAEDILNGTLNIDDGLLCVHRGQSIEYMGISLLPNIDLIGKITRDDLSKDKKYRERCSVNADSKYVAYKNMVTALDNSPLISSDKDIVNYFHIRIDYYAIDNSVLNMPLSEAISDKISCLEARHTILPIAPIKENITMLCGDAFLVVKKFGANNHVAVNPKDIKVYSNPNGENNVKSNRYDSEGVLRSKLKQKTKLPFDLSILF